METYFNDLRIVGLDEEMTQRSITNPAFRLLYLRLSGNPEKYWVTVFHQTRQEPRRVNWRKAWVEYKHIVVDCIPEELGQYLLEELKKDVITANHEFHQFLEREIYEEMRIRNSDVDEMGRLRDLKKRLNFDE